MTATQFYKNSFQIKVLKNSDQVLISSLSDSDYCKILITVCAFPDQALMNAFGPDQDLIWSRYRYVSISRIGLAMSRARWNRSWCTFQICVYVLRETKMHTVIKCISMASKFAKKVWERFQKLLELWFLKLWSDSISPIYFRLHVPSFSDAEYKTSTIRSLTAEFPNWLHCRNAVILDYSVKPLNLYPIKGLTLYISSSAINPDDINGCLSLWTTSSWN